MGPRKKELGTTTVSCPWSVEILEFGYLLIPDFRSTFCIPGTTLVFKPTEQTIHLHISIIILLSCQVQGRNVKKWIKPTTVLQNSTAAVILLL